MSSTLLHRKGFTILKNMYSMKRNFDFFAAETFFTK